MFTLGVPEMVVIFILALILFGPRKLPELGKTIGKTMTEFRRASNDLKATFEREMHSLEQENKSIQQATRDTVKQIKSTVTDSALNPLNPDTSTDKNPEGASAVSGAPSSNGTSTTATAQAETPAGQTEATAKEPQAEPKPVETAQANPPTEKKPEPALEGTVARGSQPAPTPAAQPSAKPDAAQNG